MSKIKDVKQVLGKKAYMLILEHLWAVSGGETGRQIAKSVGFSPQSALNALQQLRKLHLVKGRTAGRARIYTVNREHWFIADGLVPLWEKIENWLLHLGNDIQGFLPGKPLSVIAFGSYVKESATEKSDLDILLVFKRQKEANITDFDFESLDGHVFAKYGVHPSWKITDSASFKREVKKGEGIMRTIAREGKCIWGKNVMELV